MTKRFHIAVMAFFSCLYAQSSVFAEPLGNGTLSGPSDAAICQWEKISIAGPEEVKIGTSQEYIAIPENEKMEEGDRIVYELRKDGKLLESVSKEKYLRFFSEGGNVEIRAVLTRNNECSSEVRKKVRIYEKTLTYVGGSDFSPNQTIRDGLKSRSILLRETGAAGSSSIPGSKDYSTLLEKFRKDVEESDYLVIGAKRPAEFFEAAARMQASQSQGADGVRKPLFSGKEIYVTDEGNGYLLSLTVAGYAEQLGMERMWAITDKNVANLLMLLGTPGYVGAGIASEIDFGKTSGGTGFRKAFNRVAYAGFPVTFVGFVLSLTAAAFVLAFFRQVVGFHTFGTFGPLFLIVSISASSVQNVLTLLVSAVFSIWLTEKAFSRFRISYGARKTFSLGIYALFSIVLLSTLKWIGVFDGLEMYATQVAILPFIFVLLVADKLYGEGISGSHLKESASAIAQFSVVCFAGYFVMESASIRNALLSYPETVFAILAAIIATGRYAGLQATEYYRFLPLIREKLSETKREE